MRTHQFRVVLDTAPRSVVVKVQGEVDAATAPQMASALETQLATGRRVVADLEDVDFMDLHGLAVLLRASRQDGRRFWVARPSPCVRRLVQLVHAENELRILPDGSEPPAVA